MDSSHALAPSEARKLLREVRTSLEALYGDELSDVRLFGSYARRQAEPDSDVDVLVVLREVGDYGAQVRRVRALLSTVSLKYGKTVAPVFLDVLRLASGADPFIAQVTREAISA